MYLLHTDVLIAKISCCEKYYKVEESGKRQTNSGFMDLIIYFYFERL